MGKIPIIGFAGILAVLCLPLTTPGQVSANAVFDPARVTVGDTFTLRVLVSGTTVTPQRVNFAAWHPIIPAENILSRSTWQHSGEKWVQRFSLIVLDSADRLLPPLTVYLHLGDTVPTNPVRLTVDATTTSSDVRDLEMIRDIRREPTHWYDYWPWAAGVLLVLLVWYRFFRRRKKPQRPVPAPPVLEPPPLSPQEIAIQKLDALEREKPWQKGHLLEYYAALSMIVREYLEHRYAIPAMESTTGEIVILLKNTDFPEARRAALEVLLQKSDLVKFADTAPSTDYHAQALAKAKQVVG